MADVFNGDVAYATIEARLDGQTVQNGLYFIRDGVPSPEWDTLSLNALTAELASWVSVNLSDAQSNQLSYVRVTATQMLPDGLQVISEFENPVIGKINEEPLPNNVAACATITTGRRGKAGRGRIFIAGITGGQTERSSLTPTALANLNTQLSDLIPDMESEGFILGVYSRFLNGQPRGAGLFTRATGVAVRDPILDSQRRRLPGRGL